MYTPVLSCQETNFFERLGQKLKTNLSFLVILSFDRYLCVVYPIETMVYRTLKNAVIGCIISWIRFNIHYHMFSKGKLLLTVAIIQLVIGRGLRGRVSDVMVWTLFTLRGHLRWDSKLMLSSRSVIGCDWP